MAQHVPQFLFLCGVGRSGTTILRSSLGLHDQIYYNGLENNIIQDVVSIAIKNCMMPSRKLAMATDMGGYNQAFRDLIIRLIWPNEELATRPVLMAAINPAPDQLDFIQQLFPDCKFIGLVRHGVEVVSSRTEYRSFLANEFESHCNIWNRSANVIKWGQKSGSCLFPMRHEWCYDSQKLAQAFVNLFDWLSVSPSSKPVDNISETLRHPTSADHEMSVEQFRDVGFEEKKKYFESKRNRWRSWNSQQRKTFARLCTESMASLGYEIPWQT